MIDPQELLLGFAVGAALGVFYFGALWVTVSRVAVVRRPVAILAASFLLRMAAVIGVMIWFFGGRPMRLIGCLAAFVAARIAMTALIGRPAAGADVKAELPPRDGAETLKEKGR